MANAQKVTIIAQYDNGKGLTQDEAVATANQRKLIILSNKLLDARVVTSDQWTKENEVYPTWSGTMTAYVEPNKSFKDSNREDSGKYALYTDPETNITYRFPVPKEAEGISNLRKATNVILVVEHGFDEKGNPTFEINDDGKAQKLIYVPDDANIKVVQNFPTENGWYLTDDRFTIPTGKQVSAGEEATRYLRRIDKRVGLLARSDNNLDDYNSRHYVSAISRVSGRLGVLGIETSHEVADAEKTAPAPIAKEPAEKNNVVPVGIDLKPVESALTIITEVAQALELSGPAKLILEQVEQIRGHLNSLGKE